LLHLQPGLGCFAVAVEQLIVHLALQSVRLLAAPWASRPTMESHLTLDQ
jgi:hypothetical protein